LFPFEPPGRVFGLGFGQEIGLEAPHLLEASAPGRELRELTNGRIRRYSSRPACESISVSVPRHHDTTPPLEPSRTTDSSRG
jgi:hypothetical protein